jgi:epsilon-lactone hydrolase
MPSWQAQVLSLLSRTVVKRAVKNNSKDVDATIQMVRNWLAPSRQYGSTLPPEVRHQPVDTGLVRGEWLHWNGDAEMSQDGCLYYLHGGGYFAGSPLTHRHLTGALTMATRMSTFALDYRLAPEHKFPAAVEDAVAGYRWLLQQGFPPEKLVIGGDSAGGGLTMATVLWLRDAGLPLPAGIFLLSPWTDLACTGNSLERNDPYDDLLCGKEVHRFSKVYHGEASPHDPLVSPLYADFSTLPPLRIYVSDTEILLDDAVRLAERARCYGVDVDLRIWNRLIHAWPVMIRFRLPESKQVVDELALFIRERSGVTGSFAKAAF